MIINILFLQVEYEVHFAFVISMGFLWLKCKNYYFTDILYCSYMYKIRKKYFFVEKYHGLTLHIGFKKCENP